MRTPKVDIFKLMREKVSERLAKKAGEPADFSKDPLQEFKRRLAYLEKTGMEMDVRDVVCAAMAYSALRRGTKEMKHA